MIVPVYTPISNAGGFNGSTPLSALGIVGLFHLNPPGMAMPLIFQGCFHIQGCLHVIYNVNGSDQREYYYQVLICQLYIYSHIPRERSAMGVRLWGSRKTHRANFSQVTHFKDGGSVRWFPSREREGDACAMPFKTCHGG